MEVLETEIMDINKKIEKWPKYHAKRIRWWPWRKRCALCAKMRVALKDTKFIGPGPTKKAVEDFARNNPEIVEYFNKKRGDKMSFNECHKKSCAISRKSSLANCTCGFTIKWRDQKIIELRDELAVVEKKCHDLTIMLEKTEDDLDRTEENDGITIAEYETALERVKGMCLYRGEVITKCLCGRPTGLGGIVFCIDTALALKDSG